MDLLKMGTQLFLSQMGSKNLDSGNVLSALSKLLPTSGGGDLDIGSIMGMVSKGGLASMAASWLGDGGNESMSSNQLTSLLGDDKVSSFASELNLDKDEAANGLSNMIPDLIDKNSSGGNLMGGLASSVLGKLF